MVYSNGDIYEGLWINDLKHGYGVLEKKTGDKYYGHWNEGLKEGQGYYYYSETGKIYLGEWHEDVPRCGIFTDVDDENLKKEVKKHFKVEDAPPLIPELKLDVPDFILEDSINSVHFLRNIKLSKNKTLQELFPNELHQDLASIFNEKARKPEDEKEKKQAINYISINEFKEVCLEKLGQNVRDETLELIFYIYAINPSQEIKIDFLLFCRLFFLIYYKRLEEEKNEDPIEMGISHGPLLEKWNTEKLSPEMKEEVEFFEEMEEIDKDSLYENDYEQD
jgi:hypothetical protein